MCRILVTDMKYMRDVYRNDVESLQATLASLEASNGGDGNGVWLSTHNIILKGTEVDTSFIAGYLAEAMADKSVPDEAIVVFHTRLRSAGDGSSFSNHPFRVGKDSVLVHNGTISGWERFAVNLGMKDSAMSDTHLMAEIIKAANKEKGDSKWALEHLIRPMRPGILVIASPQLVFATRYGYGMLYWNRTMPGEGFALCSEKDEIFSDKGFVQVTESLWFKVVKEVKNA